MGQGGKKVVQRVLFMALFICAMKVALPPPLGERQAWAQHQSPQQTSKTIPDSTVRDFFVPTDLGFVISRHDPGLSTAPLIVHLQEAHTNYEAQANMVAILKDLIERVGLRLILVEGGSGDVSLASLRRFASPEIRREVSDRYLKAGLISAEEYLEVTSDYPLVLWGVEDQALYQQNVSVFLDAKAVKQRLAPLIDRLRDTVDALAPKLFEQAQRELDERIQAFGQGRVGLAAYADYLAGLATSSRWSLEAYPQVVRFLDVHRLEQRIDFSAVQAEQTALLEHLSTKLDPHALDELLAAGEGLTTGAVTKQAFSQQLAQAAASAGVDLTAFPNLFLYLRYLPERAKVEPTVLAEELDRLAAHLQGALAASPTQQQLRQIIDRVALLEKLVDLQLSPDEYVQFQQAKAQGLFKNWKEFLSAQLIESGLSARSVDELQQLEEALPTLERFYEVVQQRDAVLVDNALAKLRDSGQRIAVLITGGFHGPAIDRLLQERQVATVVVTPKTSQATDERLYEAVVRYKSGHGRLEDVMALAAEQRTEDR